MNLVRAEIFSPSERTNIGNQKPRLRSAQPLEDGLQRKHGLVVLTDLSAHITSQKPVRVRVWFDNHSPFKQFWYQKRGRKWNMAEQATSGMKWNYYLAHGKTTPVFGMMDAEHVGRFVNDTVKKIEETCAEFERADGTSNSTVLLEHKLDQIWTHAMAILARHIESDVEISLAQHGTHHIESEDRTGSEHQSAVWILHPFVQHDDSQHGIHHPHEKIHAEHHSQPDGHGTHHEGHGGHHEETLFESDAHLHPGHSRLVGGFWGSGHHSEHGEHHDEHGTHYHSHNEHHTEHGGHHNHHDENGTHQNGHGGQHHEHGGHHGGQHHEHGGHHDGHNTHEHHHTHHHGGHEEALFEFDAHLHPGHSKLTVGFWGSGQHGHAHNDNHTETHATGHQDHRVHDGHHEENSTTGHHARVIPLHEEHMTAHQPDDDHTEHGHTVQSHEVDVSHILRFQAKRIAQLRVANASAEPE
ncbi:MAG: hypothetical protein ABID61_02695 [Candidatus Micrarchaeota archaeon]